MESHTIFMDTHTGDIWAYSDKAMAGTAAPVYLGTLSALGQTVVKKR